MKDSIFKKALSVLLVLLSVYCVFIFRDLIGYILISVGLSFAGRPIVNLVSRIKIKGGKLPSAIGALVALFTFLITGGLLLAMLGPLIASQAEALAKIDTQSLAGNLKGWVGAVDKIIKHLDIGHSSLSSLLITETSKIVEFSSFSNLFGGLFMGIGSAFIAGFSILFMTFFFLKDANLFYRIILALTPDSQVDHIKNIMESSSRLLTRYFSGLIVQIAIVTIMVSSGLAIVGVKNALILGVIAGILNLIPYIGPLVGATIGLLIVVTTFEGGASDLLPHVGLAFLVYLITQLVDNFLTQPFLFSNRVKAHPLEIFIIISMASVIGGVTGMILAVPGYTLLRIIANEFLSGHKVVDALTESMEQK
tara:strand:- start:802 stop:1896 length:1095 start_codon:yes stop_codon:yes gene_type:complete